MSDAKQFAMLALKVAAALVVIGLVQEKVIQVPMVGVYLPGYKAAA